MLLNKTYCINIPLNSAVFKKEKFDIKCQHIPVYKQTKKTILHCILVFSYNLVLALQSCSWNLPSVVNSQVLREVFYITARFSCIINFLREAA